MNQLIVELTANRFRATAQVARARRAVNGVAPPEPAAPPRRRQRSRHVRACDTAPPETTASPCQSPWRRAVGSEAALAEGHDVALLRQETARPRQTPRQNQPYSEASTSRTSSPASRSASMMRSLCWASKASMVTRSSTAALRLTVANWLWLRRMTLPLCSATI